MNKRNLVMIIVAAQIALLSGMIVFHQVKLAASARIMLETEPVDPYSIFRGPYVALRYKINSLPRSLLKTDAGSIKEGQELFVWLKKGKADVWEAEGVYTYRPPRNPKTIYLRARLRAGVWALKSLMRNRDARIELEYGIESYFLNQARAKEVEQFNRRDWKEVQKERERRLAQFDDDTLRIYRSRIGADNWIKVFDSESRIWVEKGLMAPESREVLVKSYKDSAEKIKGMEADLWGPPKNEKGEPIVLKVELAVPDDGQGIPVRLFLGNKIYQ